MGMLKATVSGSFHRHMPAIYDAVGELRARGVDVLSPSDPTVVDNIGDFLFVASDRLRSIKLVQDRHLEAIRASDFLWVVCPDGYTGPSTSMEIGAAHSVGVPVYSDSPALDSTLGQYVERVPTVSYAIDRARAAARVSTRVAHVLLEPDAAIEGAADALHRLRPVLSARVGDRKADAERQLAETRYMLGATFGLK